MLSNQVGAVLAQENLKPETVVKATLVLRRWLSKSMGAYPHGIKTNAALKHYRLASRRENIRTVDKHRDRGQELCPLSQG